MAVLTRVENEARQVLPPRHRRDKVAGGLAHGGARHEAERSTRCAICPSGARPSNSRAQCSRPTNRPTDRPTTDGRRRPCPSVRNCRRHAWIHHRRLRLILADPYSAWPITTSSLVLTLIVRNLLSDEVSWRPVTLYKSHYRLASRLLMSFLWQTLFIHYFFSFFVCLPIFRLLDKYCTNKNKKNDRYG